LVVICRPTYAEMHAFPAGLVMNGMDPIDLELARDRATRVVADVRLPDTVITRDLDIDVRAYAAAPVERLVALSQQAAVLIIGSRGSGSHSHGRLGSVTTALTRRARCPVVVIP
jgi:nucleotide-binding universal stress UspA family protein